MRYHFCWHYIAFSLIPSSKVVSIGEEAVFQCRYPAADFIDWFVNGSSVGTDPPPNVYTSIIQTDNGTTVNTLTIVGRPEYNGTVVVCEAFFRDGFLSVLSPEALLLIKFNMTHPPSEGTITKHTL